MQYRYDISGTTPEEENWQWQGIDDLRSVDDFLPMVQRAIAHTFEKISSGEAAGSPGVTILGPYQITAMSFTAVI